VGLTGHRVKWQAGAVEEVDPSAATRWLEERIPSSIRDRYTGLDIDSWEANTWLLNAIYEAEEILPELSADELQRLRVEAGASSPDVVNGVNLDDLSWHTGQGLGRSRAPGDGWRRLLWAALARRESAPMASSGVPPCFRWFNYRSWPISIQPPTEGSLDRESFLQLVEILRDLSGPAVDPRIWCYYSPLAVVHSDMSGPLVLAGRLSELSAVYDLSDVHGSPNNIWPEDLSWFVYTDWDLSGTRVSGSPELIRALEADVELETVRYP